MARELMSRRRDIEMRAGIQGVLCAGAITAGAQEDERDELTYTSNKGSDLRANSEVE